MREAISGALFGLQLGPPKQNAVNLRDGRQECGSRYKAQTPSSRAALLKQRYHDADERWGFRDHPLGFETGFRSEKSGSYLRVHSMENSASATG